MLLPFVLAVALRSVCVAADVVSTCKSGHRMSSYEQSMYFAHQNSNLPPSHIVFLPNIVSLCIF